MPGPQPPPPNGPADDATFLNDPRIQAFARKITQDILQQVMPVIGEIRPGGRVVEVVRRNTENQAVRQPTTTPQLLAELNDNLIDLVDELRHSNDLAEGLRPRVKRRRR